MSAHNRARRTAHVDLHRLKPVQILNLLGSLRHDVRLVADDLRSKKAVIVNMENVDKAMARRVIDFLSGCAYALDGKVKKIAQATYLFCPFNMDVVGDLETLQSEVENYV